MKHKHKMELSRNTPIEYACSIAGCDYTESGVQYANYKKRKATGWIFAAMITLTVATALISRL